MVIRYDTERLVVHALNELIFRCHEKIKSTLN